MSDADRSTATSTRKRVLVVDIGGPHVKLLVTGADKRRKFLSAFDFEAVFGCPVRVVNDAAMQARGCYRGGFQLWDDHRRPAAPPPACQPGGTACG